MRAASGFMLAGFAFAAARLCAQQPIALVPVEGVKVSGAVDVSNGKASIGTNGVITAGERTAHISLTRGGELRLCATTTVHLAADRSVAAADSTALLMALDRGALEVNYGTGKYSDVLMTPDFRILISGPGLADLKVRVSAKGDTCVDNHGADAPYVTVSSQFDNGVYRVQANQRVMFEHGSLRDVVDNEKEPCGCPPAAPVVSVADAGTPGGAAAKPGEKVIATSPGDEFPLAVSEGLAKPPAPTAQDAAPGEEHTQITVPIAYNGATGQTASVVDGSAPPVSQAASGASDGRPAAAAAPAPAPPAASTPTATAQAPVPEKPKSQGGFFHKVGKFFSKLFGS